MKENSQKSFILYSDYYDMINELSDAEAGELVKSVFKYTNTGEIPELTGMAKMAFIVIKQNLDRNATKYQETIEKRRIAGSKGGKQRVKNLTDSSVQANQANATFAKQTQANQADNDNVNVNDNVNDNVNVNVNDNLSLLSERGEILKRGEREILENYVLRNKLAKKNVKAYVNKIIKNGDHIAILEEERERENLHKKLEAEERIRKAESEALKKKAEAEAKILEENIKEKIRREMLSKDNIERDLANIKDKLSAAKILTKYYEQCNSPPQEFNAIVKKYNLDTLEKANDYLKEYYMNKCREAVGFPKQI